MGELKSPDSDLPKITHTIPKFLEFLIGSFEKRGVDKTEAEIIHALDPTERWCHVQFTSNETGKELEYPLVWWIKAWKTDYWNWKQRKEKEAISRKENNLVTENLERIIRGMCVTSGLNYPEDRELFVRSALKIARKKNQKAANNFGVKLDMGD